MKEKKWKKAGNERERKKRYNALRGGVLPNGKKRSVVNGEDVLPEGGEGNNISRS